MRGVISVGLIAIGLSSFAQESPVPTTAPSEAAQLRKDLNEALDQLAVARAQRGDCEATLAPLEAEARRADSNRRWADLKALLEQRRPGFECNPRTLECVEKPDAKKDGPK